MYKGLITNEIRIVTNIFHIESGFSKLHTLVGAYSLTPTPMRSPQEMREAAQALTPSQREKLVGKLVSSKVQRILERETLRAIASNQQKVSLVLKAKQCTDSDRNIADFLRGSGYREVKVTSDFPGYCESYEGTTTIRYSIPE